MTRVLYVQYTSPGAYPPLVRGAELFAAAGALVLMLGTRVDGLDALDVDESQGVRIRLMPAARTGWRLKAHYARYAAWVAREGSAWKPDWIYASDVLSAPIALALNALTGARVVYHEHDAPSLDHPSWMIKRCLAARRRLVAHADIVITPNATRSATLSAVGGGRRVVTAWNTPLRPHVAPAGRAMSGRLRVIYRGSINGERLPLAVIDALADPRVDADLTVAGYETVGSRGHVDALRSRARNVGVGDRVRVLGTVVEAELTAVSTECDVGLALMPMTSRDENMRHMTGASNKVFEYLSSGIVPLVSDLPDWRSTFADPGFALACDPRDAASIADALVWAQQNRGALTHIAKRGWQRLEQDWNYETQFEPVLTAVLGHTRSREAVGAYDAEEAPCVS
ncbi:MAG TPA: glycosyltransferase [Gemmatimonadaceae bacterium]|nr:glycosyltransferase [Gemmatimonadaceae bacterium]